MNIDKLCEDAIKMYYRSILRYCLQLLGQDMHSADDCTQETFLLFWEKRNELDFNDNIRGWLYAAADRICRDYRKKEAKRLSIIETDTEKAYYQYCYNTINNASLDDISSLDIMYETQFNGQNYNPLTDLEY